MPFKLFHRRDKSNDTTQDAADARRRNRQSTPSTPQNERETVPYEATSPSRAPVMGQSPILSDNGRRSFQQSGRTQSPIVQSAAFQQNARNRSPVVEPSAFQRSPRDPTQGLHSGLQNLSLNDRQEQPASPSASASARNNSAIPHSRAVPHQPVVASDRYADAPAPLRVSRDGGDRAHMPIAQPQGRGSVTDQALGQRVVDGGSRSRTDSISRKPLDDSAQAAIAAGLRRPSQPSQAPPPVPPVHYSSPVGVAQTTRLDRNTAQDESSRSSRLNPVSAQDTSARGPRREPISAQEAPIGSPRRDPIAAQDDRARAGHVKSSSSSQGQNGYLVRDADTAPSLEGIVDLTNTADTIIHEKWAPAVTHETIHTHHHHIREELITREIHNHDVHHRILPIIDVQVLPARHFVWDPANPEQEIEITEDQIPGRGGDNSHWVIAETVSKLRAGETPHGERIFSARKFGEHEGEARQWTDRQGVQRSEQTWVHAPEVEDGARLTHQSIPFHFGSNDGGQDGIRHDLS